MEHWCIRVWSWDFSCDWRRTQVVANLVLFFLRQINEIPFSHSILNRFWSTRSQMIGNSILHHIMKIIFLIHKFWVKKIFTSWILEKTPVWSEQILASCETSFPFLNIFQILQACSNSIKEHGNSLIFKNNFNFLKKCFCDTPPSQIISKSSFIKKFRMKNIYFNFSLKWKQNVWKNCTWGSLPPPPFPTSSVWNDTTHNYSTT